MYKYTLRRLIQGVVVIWVVTTVVFLLERLTGNPALMLAGPEASQADILAISTRLGLQAPVYVQYLNFIGGLLHGDMGQSYGFSTPVSTLILNALPYTVELAVVALAFASIVGVSLGTVSAVKSGTWVDQVARFVALIGQSIPVFWLGIMLVLLFSVTLHLLPSFGAGTPANFVLPALVLSVRPLAFITRLSRSATLEVLEAEHTLFQRSKGVGEFVVLRHLVRNASLPVMTLVGVQLGDLLGGSVIVETLFGWPGIGQLAVKAIGLRDFAVIQGVVIVDTIAVVAMNLVVDLTYGWLDPRVRRRRVVD